MLRSDLGKCRVEGEVVAPLLAVRLVTLEVVDRCPDGFAGLPARTDRVDRMPDHGQHLKGNHRLVVLDKIPDKHQNLFRSHHAPPSGSSAKLGASRRYEAHLKSSTQRSGNLIQGLNSHVLRTALDSRDRLLFGLESIGKFSLAHLPRLACPSDFQRNTQLDVSLLVETPELWVLHLAA